MNGVEEVSDRPATVFCEVFNLSKTVEEKYKLFDEDYTLAEYIKQHPGYLEKHPELSEYVKEC